MTKTSKKKTQRYAKNKDKDTKNDNIYTKKRNKKKTTNISTIQQYWNNEDKI